MTLCVECGGELVVHLRIPGTNYTPDPYHLTQPKVHPHRAVAACAVCGVPADEGYEFCGPCIEELRRDREQLDAEDAREAQA